MDRDLGENWEAGVPKIGGPGDCPKSRTDDMVEEISARRCQIRPQNLKNTVFSAQNGQFPFFRVTHIFRIIFPIFLLFPGVGLAYLDIWTCLSDAQGMTQEMTASQASTQGRMGPPRGDPPKNPKIRKKRKKTNVFWSKTRFLASPGRDLSNHGGFFRFGALRGTGKFRYIFRHFFAKIPIPIQAFAYAGQAPMPSFGQVRSRSSGFMWSELWEALHLAQSPNFPVFQGVQARPIILPYVKI